MESKLVKIGKQISFLLRHSTKYINEHGWANISDILNETSITREELNEIVKTNDKKRYEISNDELQIRAVQGHSVTVDIGFETKIPPSKLYHGTAVHFVGSIMKEGITKRSRLYVHLSETKDIAREVGKRHGHPAVLVIDANAMYNDGITFFQSKNGVWLTEYVDPKYITFNEDDKNKQ